jgi:cyclopropane-fatty-acyl-phospholipid synthase
MTHRDVFLHLLESCLLDIKIRVEMADESFEVGGRSEKEEIAEFVVKINNPRFFSRVLCYGNLGLGEAYIDGNFELRKGTLDALLTAFLRNRLDERVWTDFRLAARIGAIRIANVLRGRTRNVRGHYDLGDDLFEAFLDKTLTYSCGYAQSPTDSLESLQFNKLDRICKKLDLRPGERLLDIGCGYGGLLIHAAKHYGVRADGVTISEHHFELGRARIREEGLADRCQIALKTYAEVDQSYDKVVTVGMMEHLHPTEYKRFIRKVAAALAYGGRALLHTIGRSFAKNTHDPFMQKYIFPGSSLPSLSEVSRQLERCHLLVLDVENIIRHYALTLGGWLQRFRANRGSLDQTKYNERFARMWEYYLSCGIAAARASDCAAFQILVTNDRASCFPLHRI